jgi:sulfate adenylyltransferase
MLVNPHGQEKLKPLLVHIDERATELKRAEHLVKVPLSSRELSDLLMLAMGAYTPLNGFMGEEDWRNCCKDMMTSSGVFWPIPITLSSSNDISSGIKIGDEVALVSDNNKIFGILRVEQKYKIDKELECASIFRTTDTAHPGVAKVMNQEEVNLSGPVKVLDEDHYPETYKGLYYKPEETRALFNKNGWSTVAAFQTRNPMHRSHEYLAKIAIEICDGLLIHQVLGALKPGDIPADVRVASIDSLVKNYFVEGSVVQAGYPIEMRYGGPREALLHAVFRQNFGCSHLVVGRDHAGIGNYYGPFDAHHIFDEVPVGSLETQAIKIDITFYCYKCNGMATGRTCPHGEDQRLNVSGTRLREMLSNNETVPTEFSRPEVLDVLKKFYYKV